VETAPDQLDQKMSQLKAMSFKGGRPKGADAPVHPEEDDKPRTLDEFIDRIKDKIVGVKHYRTGRIDDYGHVEGIYEYPAGSVPHMHQSHHLDASGRPIMLEIFEKDFTKPLVRFYFYEGESNKVNEAVWLDRYGKIDNIHRYVYEPQHGLLVDRAEYNKEGQIFYQIHSDYDTGFDPIRKTQETWRDKKGAQIQRFAFKYDEQGDVNIEERYDDGDRLLGYFQITYTESRERPAKKEWFGPDSKLRSFFQYEYDATDSVTRSVLFNASGVKEATQVFVYDEIGNLKEEHWLDAEDKQFKHLKY
jgi:hypothetical protein